MPGLLGIALLYLISGMHARAAARSRKGAEAVLFTVIAGSIVIAAAHGVILSLFVEPVYTLTVSLVVGLAVAGATSLPVSIFPWRKSPPA